MIRKVLAAVAVGLLSLWAIAFSQTVTASISGSVEDPSGQVIAGATVTLMNQGTGAHIRAVTDSSGNFIFTGLLPSTYTVEASHAGFKKFERRELVLTAGEHKSAGNLKLEIGALSETVTVTAQTATIQTASAERSGLISEKQATDLMLIGRDYLDLMRTLPGVADFSSHETPAGFNFNMSIQGNRPGMNNVTLDGATNINTGGQTGTWLSPSVDSIAEVKVLLNNYQAEYGRNAGASVNVITKSGTRQFHGTGYYFKRNEVFNANDFFFKARRQPRPRYRYDFGGFNLGGPVTIPGKFNAGRDKLFFFFAQEFMPQSFPNSLNTLTVPTAAERQGDFSHTFDQNRRLIAIKDPDTGLAFPGNIIPAERIDRNMQKLLGVLPLPNAVDPSGAYNYVSYDNYRQPRNETLFRTDYRINDRNSLYVRGVFDRQTQEGGYGLPIQGGNWPLIRTVYDVPSKGGLIALQQSLSPTLIHEFSFGTTRGVELGSAANSAAVDRVSRQKLGMTLSQFHPNLNTLDLIPNATFGGVPNAANIAFESRYPFFGANNLFDITDNLTKVQGAHTLKGGIFFERIRRAAKRGAVFNGAFDFTRDPNNPLDTGWAYSNALLGVYRSYAESDTRPWANVRASNIEWYVQDTWKLNKKLTLDYGMRFSIFTPQYERDRYTSGFVPERFDPAKAGVLIRPVKNAAGARVGFNPITGQTVPAVLIGSLAAGDAANGMVSLRADKSYPAGLQNDRGVQLGPRFGFAYDPKGDGKTAIRGGFGVTYDRVDGFIVSFTENPPLEFTPTSFYGRTADFLSSGSLLFPSNVSGISRAGQVPTVMSFSLGVQRDIGFGTTLDVAYVGSLSRHLRQSVNLNGIRYGADFLPSNADPTSPGKPLPPNFLRPYPGLGDINYFTYDASSNYHSMQVQAHRRFARPFQISGVWTWSKTMDTSDGGSVSRFLDTHSRYYGRAGFDRTHIVNVNWMYDLPRISQYWKHAFARWVLDQWQFTGIASFVSGAPLGVNFTTTDGADIAGTPTELIRPDLIAAPELPKSRRTMLHYFNTNAFARPAKGTIGNSAKDVIRGPGINNWDMGLYKNFAIREHARVQFRWETYNTFNHTQFSNVDTTARFDPAGTQVNARFGQLIATRNPRRMQVAVKFIF